MPKKTGFKLTGKPMFLKPSRFEQKWGEPAWKIAEREDVSITNIHMRIRNYSSPYQRKAKPSLAEQIYGKTYYELGLEFDMHPVTIYQRLRKYGKVDCEAEMSVPGRPMWSDGSWKTDIRYKHQKCWLMPEHEKYEEWMSQFK